MTVFAVGNQGGSAGKTTFVVNAAARIARLTGQHVRVIDLDSQANASHHLGQDEPGDDAPTISDVLFEGAGLADADRAVAAVDGLTVVPGRRNELVGAEQRLGRVVGGEQRLRMAIAADPSPPAVTFIDCPGVMSTITVTALVAATAAVTVFAPMEKEAAAVAEFEATVNEVIAAYNPGLRLAAVVPSIVPPGRGRYYSDVLALIRDGWGDLVTPAVRRSIRVPESYSAQLPLIEHSPAEPVTQDLADVVQHLADAGLVDLTERAAG